jgi:hypothetical protein
MRAAASMLIVVLLCFGVAAQMAMQQKQEWTWKDRNGQIRSKADLDEILRQHKLWLESDGKTGVQLGIYGADFSGADLSGADLRKGTILKSSLSHTNLLKADLRETVFIASDLNNVNLRNADLRGTEFFGSDLREGVLTGADMGGASLLMADVGKVVFQPKDLPTTESTASARNLDLLTYDDNPGPLTRLRKQFQDDGYREPERAITCALNRHDANPMRLLASLREKWKSVRGKPFHDFEIMPLWSFVEAAFKWVAFDLTCAYGFRPGRPLRIVGILWLVFSLVYAAFMHMPGTSGIYFIGNRVWRGRSNTQGIQIRPGPIPAAKSWKRPFLWLAREWRVLRAAMFFSLMSAFNIGFRDINFGRWLRLLTRREYDLKAVGWARTVSGFQSLLSVYLIALWVLSYFGRPFG